MAAEDGREDVVDLLLAARADASVRHAVRTGLPRRPSHARPIASSRLALASPLSIAFPL